MSFLYAQMSEEMNMKRKKIINAMRPEVNISIVV